MKKNNDEGIIKMKLDVYLKNFPSETLEDCENAIYTKNVSSKSRLKSEIRRTKSFISLSDELYVSYYPILNKLEKLLELMEFDSSLKNELYKEILKIQLKVGMRIRLYSGIELLREEYYGYGHYPKINK